MADQAEQCKQAPGTFAPVINRNKCEGKADCVPVCPYHVFEVHVLSGEQKRGLSLLGRLKALAHGNRQAFAVRAEECHACGLCVAVCPENAITLTRLARGAA